MQLSLAASTLLTLTWGATTLLLGLSVAQAQCAEGRVVGPDTGGRCCWPGQRFDEEYGRCSGAPSGCPPGMGAMGDECVARQTARVEGEPGYDDYAEQPAPAAASEGWWGEDDSTPSQPPVAQRTEAFDQTPARTEPFMELLQAGISLLSIGYGASLGFASAAATQVDSWTYDPTSWHWGLVPLIGGFVWGAEDEGCCPQPSSMGLYLGVPAAGVQVVGLVLTIVGGLVRRPVARSTSRDEGGRLRLTRGPGEVGLGAAWYF
ncbi:MAG: hypothetical protein SangKO_096410 [Sandaracinaceae bacterium]